MNIAIFDISAKLREKIKFSLDSNKKIENIYLFGNYESLTKLSSFTFVEYLIITAESIKSNITIFKKLTSDPRFTTKIIFLYDYENQSTLDLTKSIDNLVGVYIPSLNKAQGNLISELKLKLLPILENGNESSKLDRSAAPKNKLVHNNYCAVFVGVSMGGPKALRNFLPKLLSYIELPVIITQHIMSKYSQIFVDTLNNISPKEIVLAEHNMIVRKNTAYVAPGGIHIEVGLNQQRELIILHNNSEPEESCKPSINYLFRSAANICRQNAIAVILTGMGRDGSEGIIKLSEVDAYTIAQDERSCEVSSMPHNAIKTGCIDQILPLEKIADYIKKLVS